MNRISEKVNKLMRKCRTNDPFAIAECLDLPIIIEPLGEMWGYCHSYKRIQTIHINSKLSSTEQRFTCGHELGHIILHPKLNTPFLRANTLFSLDKIEREANQFAVELLMPDQHIYTYDNLSLSIAEIASAYGVPAEFAELKCAKEKHKFFYPFF